VKRTTVLGALLALAAAVASAQIDPTIARIKLTKVEVITQKQFRAQVESIETSLKRPLTKDQREQYLQALVDQKLLLQAADREHVRAAPSEVDRTLDAYKQDFARQLGRPNRPLSDSELKDLLQQQGTTYEQFVGQITDKITVEKLVAKEQKPLLDSVKDPTETEIQDYYNSNRTRFVSPEMVRFKQIVVLTTGLSPADADRAKAKAEEIYRAIQSGTPFDKFQEVYLEGGTTRIGGLNFDVWRRDDEAKRVTYGKTFFDSLFDAKPGEVKGVLQSNAGYHIVEIIEEIPFKVLGLDDKIPPQNAATVRDQIAALLRQMRRVEIVKQATDDLTKKLRGEAEIRVEDKLLSW
jgi:parvulin-like peptidyl-prolyl isomerase